jgi:parvulin-like peptidyl-prolyl isomerase
MKPNKSWSDSVRRRFGGRGTSSQAPVRRLSRRDQEARYQRVFYLTMAGVAGLIALILGIGAFYEYQIKPNAVLAEVNGHEISRRDYWQYQSVVLYQQARTYESFAMQTSGQQQQQFLQFAASFDAQRDDVWGSTDVSSATLQQMIDDRLYLDGAEALGIQVSEEEAAAFALNQFAPPDAPLTTPLPSPTMIPERAQMATETANAMATEQAIAMGTPVASPIASPGAGTPAATPQATPISSETPASTPNMEDARTAAEAEYEIFQDNVFEEANMSEEDYIRLWARPQLARQLVDHQLTSQVPQVAEQVNAQHILVATQDLANQLHKQATGGADFGQLARSSSTDTITAPTGGQLGWFTRLEMDPAFAEAAFALEPGQISEPVQTPFGWHIIRAIEKDPERALTESQYNLATTETVDEWLELQRTESDVSSDHIESTPTPTPGSFVPPANAPTPVPATPVPMTPTPTPPLVGPVPVTPDATPAGSPAAAPGSTPIATPAGTPEVPAVG